MNYTATINLEDALRSAIGRIKGELQKELEKQALEMVTAEVAKFSLDLAQYVSFKDLGREICITVRKDLK